MTAPAHSALYLSVPFCRSKCSFCNFASGVFSRQQFEGYVEHLERAMDGAESWVRANGGDFDPALDSIYLGGGTPSVLAPDQLERLFKAAARSFRILPGAEVTVEVAPGTLTPEILDVLVRTGVNRVSLGVQSFVDEESRAVGRLHTRATTLDDIARLRHAGITEISVDLIAGLPHQSLESWSRSLDEVIALGVPHASVYMLEVDDDSRLGRELIAGGTRYHAHHVPDEAETVEFYREACQRLNEAGLAQYEISNFARPGHRSRHNLRYWQRLPYLGFGVDAHSMLAAPTQGEPHRAIRLAWPETIEALLANTAAERTVVGERQAIEETYFLGLRMVEGLELLAIKEEFGLHAVEAYKDRIVALVERGLVEVEDGFLRLTAEGRLFSNDVFAEFLADDLH